MKKDEERKPVRLKQPQAPNVSKVCVCNVHMLKMAGAVGSVYLAANPTARLLGLGVAAGARRLLFGQS